MERRGTEEEELQRVNKRVKVIAVMSLVELVQERIREGSGKNYLELNWKE